MATTMSSLMIIILNVLVIFPIIFNLSLMMIEVLVFILQEVLIIQVNNLIFSR